MSSLGRSLTESLAELLASPGEGRRDSPLAHASMAAAALVATTEGDVSFAERAMLDQAIDALAARDGIEPHAAAAAFEDFVEAIQANSSQGRRSALAAIGALEGVAGAAAVVLRIAEAVAAADGAASATEIEAVHEVAALLGVGRNR